MLCTGREPARMSETTWNGDGMIADMVYTLANHVRGFYNHPISSQSLSSFLHTLLHNRRRSFVSAGHPQSPMWIDPLGASSCRISGISHFNSTHAARKLPSGSYQHAAIEFRLEIPYLHLYTLHPPSNHPLSRLLLPSLSPLPHSVRAPYRPFLHGIIAHSPPPILTPNADPFPAPLTSIADIVPIRRRPSGLQSPIPPLLEIQSYQRGCRELGEGQAWCEG